MDLTREDSDEAQIDIDSFFHWFSAEDEETEIAELIKEELWLDPLKYYFSLDDEDPDEIQEEQDDEDGLDNGE